MTISKDAATRSLVISGAVYPVESRSFARRFRLQFIPLQLLLLVSILGCGRTSDMPRAIVEGTVTYDGQPIEKGRIRFEPLPGTRGNLSVGVIDHGEYRIDDFGGVPVGKHRIELYSYDPNDPAGGPGGPPPKQFLPAKYNYESTIELEIEATPSPVVHDFTLEK